MQSGKLFSEALLSSFLYSVRFVALFWKQFEDAALNLGLQIPGSPSANAHLHPSRAHRPALSRSQWLSKLWPWGLLVSLGSQDTGPGLTLRVARAACLLSHAPAGGCFHLLILSLILPQRRGSLKRIWHIPNRGLLQAGGCRVPRKPRARQAIFTCVITGS